MLLVLFLSATLQVADPDDPGVVPDSDRPTPDRPVPDRTVVVAPRAEVPATTTDLNRIVIAGDALLRTGENSLPRAIARAGGIWVQETNLGGGSPFIRGLTGNQVLVVIDGVRLNDSTTRFGPNQSLNTIDPMIVDSVEILRGPASVLYGSDAIGGAILIWTKRRRPRLLDSAAEAGSDVGAELDLVGQTASEGGRGTLGLWHVGERTGTYVAGGGQDWKDLRSGDDELVPNTGYHGNDFFASEEFAFDEQRSLRATARIHRDFDVPRTDRVNVGFGQTVPSDQRFLFTLQERQTFQLTYADESTNALWDGLALRLAASTYEERRDRIGTGSSSRRLETDEVQTLSLGLDMRRALGDEHFLTIGFDLYHDDVDSSRTDEDLTSGALTAAEGQFAPNSKYTTAAVFLQDEVFAFDRLDVTAGVRYSYTSFGFDEFASQGGGSEDGDFDALTASLQVAGNPTEDLRLTGSLAQGFRAPNLDDLGKNGAFAGGTELANPDLDPERSLTAEIVAEIRKDSWNFGISAYATRISDLIGRRLIDSGGPQTGDETYVRDNVADADLIGTEVAYGRRLGGLESPWSIELSLGYVHGVLDDDTVDETSGEAPFDGEPVRRIPPFHGRVGFTYEPSQRLLGAISWARFETAFAASQTRLHPEDESDPRIDPDGTDGWVVVNLECGGPLGDPTRGSTWNLGLLNVLDESYRIHGSGFDAPGVGLVAGLHLSF